MRRRAGLDLFGSRVGRRVFALLALAGLAPALLAAYLTYHETTQGLREAAFDNLRDDAKRLGMEIVAALQHRANLARGVLHQLQSAGTGVRLTDTSSEFEAIWQLQSDGGTRLLAGDRISPIAREDLDRRHLGYGRSQLLTVDTDTGNDWVLILEATSGVAGDQGFTAFRLSADGLWAPRAYLPYDFAYCVTSPSLARLHCSDTGDGAALPELRPDDRSTGQFVEIGEGEDARLAVSWPLFLEGEFAFQTVGITTSVRKNHALRALAGIQQIFPALFVFITLFVSVISLQLIRRNLVPLKKLTIAATQYARGRLDTRVSIRSNDEFATLGSAFNKMARRLGMQIRALKHMSDVDRLILSAASFDDIVAMFLRHLSTLVNGPACAVLAFDPENASIATLTTHGNGSFRKARLQVDSTLLTAETQWIELSEAQPQIAAQFHAFDARYLRFMPVGFNDNIKGAVVIGSATANPLNADVLAQCNDLIARLAIGIASAEREEVLYRQAHFDELTGLPNRQLLKDRLSQSLSRALRSDKSGAILFIDLDRFKEVNDVYGHSVGDTLLKQASERITGVCRDADTVARLGGDEFVVLVPEIESGDEAGELAIELVELLSQPFEIMGTEHALGASIGIALYPEDGNSVEILLRNSDAAMYRAKGAGRNRYEFFSEKLNVESRRRLMLERDLRNAIRDDQLELHYQPQFYVADDSLRGAESLVRWRHPEQGNIPPGEFIDVAEQSDLIVDVGRWVLHRACRDLRELLDASLDPGIVAVNVSARQLSHPDFVRHVVDALTRYELEPGYLEIEITESVVAQNRETAIATLATLRDIGVQIGMDDFGTGYSSLSYLRMLPFDSLKIDQSFVATIGDSGDHGAESICRAIITMAHELGKRVVAEGIETETHREFMRRHDCDMMQGYLLARPAPIAEFRRILENRPVQRRQRRKLEAV